jgi:hypothetical protein
MKVVSGILTIRNGAVLSVDNLELSTKLKAPFVAGFLGII